MSTTIDETRAGGRRPGDAIFKGTAIAAALVILLALAGVAVFLLYEGIPGILGAREETDASFVSYVWPLVYGTLVAALIALVIATPFAVGMALVISHYAPKRIAKPLGYVVDLLAAVPSVVYGVWGITVLGPQLVPLYRWLADTVPWIPFFAGPASTTGRTIFTAGVVLAIMILPIITAICREIFAQTPTLHQEAALALGATRWEMIRMAVFPYARSGMISATMLGLGRALGETMAVALVLSASGVITLNFISSTNPSTIAANIALRFPEATGLAVNLLIASGLVLFAITFAVNFAARYIAGSSARRMSR
ncbi:phosphate ABC transporter permease subunit PstC [Nocardioides sp. CFH 31398]|uniref:phosphate ABC transporter permease subunit PstC n=1 Tax=Nocardioides sp. CFH 31398 TaxID=2919579 RepID=UPI001F052E19|nr:phosphate ABC transporter permease subunit PstC [Nocardioides sp. CFH 31398]MCH1866039.1 phosphate ABC transporter permease subunit PstC [Nocardioides sp. CFH 31398]